MSVFGDYSKYYDLLYKDKDYKGEVEYIDSLIKEYNSNTKNILELGCGTGKHANLLTNKGYKVFGIDRSDEMLEKAKLFKNNNFDFEKADVRTFRINKKFDTVLSLFHVASYQTSNEDLENYFKTARIHLNKIGIFIFDCWYGPAVLSQKPVKRTKEFENTVFKLKRIAEPHFSPKGNIVEVNYTIDITDKISNKTEQLKETHRMRYLFDEEIKKLMKANNFEFIASEEWLSKKQPNNGTWSVCFVGKGI
jgi:SAM-dependent methyltransferase